MSDAKGIETARLTGFSDAVFAFALTLLVVSLEVPRTYHELMGLVRGFLPFAFSFTLLVWIWYEHSAFFGRYPLRDGFTIVLNAVLLFVVLFYVYPLKYVSDVMFHPLLPEMAIVSPSTDIEAGRLFIVYGVGYASVFAALAALYVHAWRKRATLQLTPLDALDARLAGGAHLISVAVGTISILWALTAPSRLVVYTGFIYFLMAPARTIYGAWSARTRRAFLARTEPGGA